MIQFTLSRPGVADFEACPVWCPYQYPWELDELRKWGAHASEIQSSILDAVAKEHSHPHYSIPAGLPIGARDLIYAAVDLKLPNHEANLFGYLVISDKQPTALCIFYQDEEFCFYCDPAESNENIEEMVRMTGCHVSQSLTATLKPRISPPDVDMPRVFEIK